MKRFRDHRWLRRITAGSVLFGIIAVSSVAYAAWTATGGGQGYAKAGTAQVLTTVDVSATTTATLYPSGTGNVFLKITNPNTYAVTADPSGAGHTVSSMDVRRRAAVAALLRRTDLWLAAGAGERDRDGED